MRKSAAVIVCILVMLLCGCTGQDEASVFDESECSFTYDEITYELHLCEGEEGRLGVCVAVIDDSGVTYPGEYYREVEEPIDGQVKTDEIVIEGTGMKFVYGKVFGKRYKPSYNGVEYGRLDQNNMFFYCMKENENVDILYR